jgi:hypothetical protein
LIWDVEIIREELDACGLVPTSQLMTLENFLKEDMLSKKIELYSVGFTA